MVAVEHLVVVVAVVSADLVEAALVGAEPAEVGDYFLTTRQLDNISCNPLSFFGKGYHYITADPLFWMHILIKRCHQCRHTSLIIDIYRFKWFQVLNLELLFDLFQQRSCK